MIDQLKLLWADGNKRKGIIYGVIALIVIWMYISVSSSGDNTDRSSRRYASKEGSIFGVSTSASQIGEQDSAGVIKELTQTFEEREKDLDVRERHFEKKFTEQETVIQNLQSSIFELTRKVDAAVKLQSRDLRADDAPSKAGQTGANMRVEGEQGYVDAVGNQNNLVQRRQTQIITPEQPAIEGRVIRTITQRKVREVHKSGEVEQKDIEITELTQRNQKVTNKSATSKSEPENKSVVGENDGEFALTMGSIITGVLINGAALPTSSSGQKDPMPILLRIKKEAIMPNHFTLDIKECHLLGSGIGDLATSRGHIRAEAISCITHDGQAIEKNLTAYAVSSGDGMSGISGDVVFKSGAMMLNAMKADFLANVGQAIAPQRVQSLNTRPGDSALWETQNLEYAGASGIAGGIGGASSRLADYYMDMVDATFPVIEILPGTEVDFIVQKGMTMKLNGESMVGLTNE